MTALDWLGVLAVGAGALALLWAALWGPADTWDEGDDWPAEGAGR